MPPSKPHTRQGVIITNFVDEKIKIRSTDMFRFSYTAWEIWTWCPFFFILKTLEGWVCF